jgi:TolB-like protein/tetratricopeptide (TPR) repeat protein
VAQAPEVFVSYSREDATRVSDLVGKLRAAGVSLWIDQGGIDAASQWSEQIVNALESAKAMLLMVSGSAVHSHNVAKEVVLVSERKGHILPVHLQPTVIPPALKYQLAGIQHVEYFQESDEALKAILRALERLGVKIAPPAVRAPPLAPRQPEGAAPAAAASLERGALAVMPFDNISPDQETDYFSDGLTEELMARLSLVSEIELISRWASKQMRDRKGDVRAIREELGARYIVGGSVRRFQDSVRITVQLVDTTTDRPLWGNTYKGKLDDIFDIQEQVAQQIVEALKLKLSFAEKISLTKRQTGNAQAYDLYLRGLDYMYRMTKRSMEYAIQLFEKAIEIDPRYAAAYAACSSACGQMYQYFSRDEQHRTRAQELSFKALMYDSNLPEAYTAMGLSYFLWDKLDEASASSRKAIELNPDDFVAHWTLGRIEFTNGELAEAYREFQRVIELKPTFFTGYLDFAMTCERLERLPESRAARARLLELIPTYLLQNPDDSRARVIYAVSLSEAQRPDDALKETAKALELSPDDPLILYNCACVYARLGQKQRALDTLKKSGTAPVNAGWMKNDPDLASLRDEPDFITLLASAKR